MLKLFTLCIKNIKKNKLLYGEKKAYYVVRDFWDTLYI